MEVSQNRTPAFRLNSAQMAVGAVLIGAGGLIGVAGLIVGTTAVLSASRRWFRELQVAPTEVARHKWGQTKAATAAGARAWQQRGDGVPARSSRS